MQKHALHPAGAPAVRSRTAGAESPPTLCLRRAGVATGRAAARGPAVPGDACGGEHRGPEYPARRPRQDGDANRRARCSASRIDSAMIVNVGLDTPAVANTDEPAT